MAGSDKNSTKAANKEGEGPLLVIIDSPRVERTAEVNLIGPYNAPNQLITFSLDSEFES